MLFFICTLIFTVVDFASKILTIKYLKPLSSVTLIEGFVSLTYVENRGAAFGILQNARWVFIFFTIIAAAGIIYYKLKYKPRGKVINTALCLTLSGALGNLIDRISLGYVIDMIEVTFVDYPVFNIADCLVVTGGVLLGIYILFIYKEP